MPQTDMWGRRPHKCVVLAEDDWDVMDFMERAMLDSLARQGGGIDGGR